MSGTFNQHTLREYTVFESMYKYSSVQELRWIRAVLKSAASIVSARYSLTTYVVPELPHKDDRHTASSLSFSDEHGLRSCDSRPEAEHVQHQENCDQCLCGYIGYTALIDVGDELFEELVAAKGESTLAYEYISSVVGHASSNVRSAVQHTRSPRASHKTTTGSNNMAKPCPRLKFACRPRVQRFLDSIDSMEVLRTQATTQEVWKGV